MMKKTNSILYQIEYEVIDGFNSEVQESVRDSVSFQ